MAALAEHVGDAVAFVVAPVAGRLPPDALERSQRVERAVRQKGSLVAMITAKLMGLQ